MRTLGLEEGSYVDENANEKRVVVIQLYRYFLIYQPEKQV